MDKEVLEEIYLNYYNKLIKYAFILVENNFDAEDVVQDVFLKLPRIFNTYDSKKGSFDSWIFKVVKNEANSIIKKKQLS